MACSIDFRRRVLSIKAKGAAKRIVGVADMVRRPGLMCQHFSGHKVKQILAAIRSPLATNSYWPNEFVHGCKTPQCIQIYPA